MFPARGIGLLCGMHAEVCRDNATEAENLAPRVPWQARRKSRHCIANACLLQSQQTASFQFILRHVRDSFSTDRASP